MCTTSKFHPGCYWLSLYHRLYTSSKEVSNKRRNSPSLLVQAKALIFTQNSSGFAHVPLCWLCYRTIGKHLRALGLSKFMYLSPKSFSFFKNRLNSGKNMCIEGTHKMAKISQFTKKPMFSFVIWSSCETPYFQASELNLKVTSSLFLLLDTEWARGTHSDIQLFSALDYRYHINW